MLTNVVKFYVNKYQQASTNVNKCLQMLTKV